MAASALLVAGCATVDPKGGFAEVEALASARGAPDLVWRQGADEDRAIDGRVASLLAQPLTVDGAVEVALLRNPRLQATYERLGIAQADVVQAGLLANPTLVGAPRFGVGSVSGTNVELDFAQNLIQLLTLRARKQLAQSQFHAVQAEVGHEVQDLASAVRRGYFDAVAARHQTGIAAAVLDAAEASSELARRLHAAGNLSDLALARERALQEDAGVVLERVEAAAVSAREELARLLAAPEPSGWSVAGQLPGLPHEHVLLAGLEDRAVALRLDAAAARQELAAFEQALTLVERYRWVPFVEVGVSAERETEGGWVVGPELALELPLFDRGQAKVARLEAQVRSRKRTVEAIEMEIRSSVREATERLVRSRSIAERYRTSVIPLRERILALATEEYNFMLVGAFELLSAKRAEIDAYEGYVDALRGYWTARADLQGAVGAALEVGPPPAPAEPEEPATHGGADGAPEKGPHHHHGDH